RLPGLPPAGRTRQPRGHHLRDHRQPLQPQQQQHPGLAGRPPPHPPRLHPHGRLLAEPAGSLVADLPPPGAGRAGLRRPRRDRLPPRVAPPPPHPPPPPRGLGTPPAPPTLLPPTLFIPPLRNVAPGARPLAAEVQALARRARLGLGPHAATTAAGAPPPAAQLGLTRREREVLALVAAGRGHRQLAQAVFTSPKTASVHGSNTLRPKRLGLH